jgi:hypothetical protein
VPGEWVAIANGRPLRVKGTVRSAAANAFDRGVAFSAASATNPGGAPGSREYDLDLTFDSAEHGGRSGASQRAPEGSAPQAHRGRDEGVGVTPYLVCARIRELCP